MKNVIIYSRVSTTDQIKGYSLRNQESKLREYSAERNLNILRHFQDSQSAKDFNRKDFDAIYAYASAHKIDGLLVTRWDRFSRSEIDESIAMIKKLRALGVEVQAIEQPINWKDPQHTWSLLIFLNMAYMENVQIASRVTSGMRKARKEGRWVARAPFGYRNARDEKNKPIILPSDDADVVRNIFRDLVNGETNVDDLFRKYKQRGYKRTVNVMRAMLRNPIYIGYIRLSETDTEKQSLERGIHEPLIDRDTFEKAQAILDGRSFKRAMSVSENYPLKGHLLCPSCGYVMTCGSAKSSRYYYYRCGACHKSVNTVEADTAMISFLSTLKVPRPIAEVYIHILKSEFDSRTASGKSEKDKLQKEADRLSDRVPIIGNKFIDGEIDRETYETMRNDLYAKRDALKQRIGAIEDSSYNFHNYLNSAGTILTDADRFYATSDAKIKNKLIGCIFPEKLTYENGSYATSRINTVLESMLAKNNELQNIKGRSYLPQPCDVGLSVHQCNDFMVDLSRFAELMVLLRR